MVDIAFRAKLRETLLGLNIPASNVDEVVDLALLAAKESTRVLKDVVFRAEDSRVSITALGIAISIARDNLDRLEAASLDLAALLNLRASAFNIEVPRNG